jgi:hypothetical protein
MALCDSCVRKVFLKKNYVKCFIKIYTCFSCSFSCSLEGVVINLNKEVRNDMKQEDNENIYFDLTFRNSSAISSE